MNAPLSLAATLLLYYTPTPAVALTPLETEISAANGNQTTLRTQLAPSWSTTSPVRSTSDLLWTSIVTLFLCVYTVIHVNIPPPDESRRKFYGRKCLWALVAILAPEYALCTAYHQWDAARRLQHEMNEFVDKPERPATSLSWTNRFYTAIGGLPKKQTAPNSPLSMTYCFYVVMGGFSVDIGSLHNDLKYITITPAGLIFLAKHGHFIKLPEKDIQDKSKADVIAKGLVCVQVAWLIIQSVGRAANSLPIALLEIHVLAHVAYALMLYGIWFKKPLDVQEPTIVDSSMFGNELALMLVLSLGIEEIRAFNSHLREIQAVETSPREFRLQTIEPSPKRNIRWENASKAIEKSIELDSSIIGYNGFQLLTRDEDLELLSLRAKDVQAIGFVGARSGFFKLRQLHRGFGHYTLVVGAMIFLTAAYAGIHAAAWRYHFPTETEMRLWRGSSILIASIVPVTLFLMLIFFIVALAIGVFMKHTFDVSTAIKKMKGMGSFGDLGILFFISSGTLLHFSARLFLFIEAFISVRQMPIGVFVTVQWSDYIPHL
ncbi:hypothetical protein F5Y14DRAFT_404580 [Nemania sp. NC0429]|nr:hypothetical protein F5Y14DRAFT_404580 [Nemania sp. NC0429]